MSNQHPDRLQVFYNSESKPYIYGVVRRYEGATGNMWYETPYVVSKTERNGRQIIYGTVRRMLDGVVRQKRGFEDFNRRAAERLNAAGIEVDPHNPVLPDTELGEQIIEEQEEIIEDILFVTSIRVRAVGEIFRTKLDAYEVDVYDYENNLIGRVKLSSIGNLFAHNRYLLIQGEYVVDLISDRRFLDVNPQMGLRINFLDYMETVGKAINDLTVEDLATVLKEMVEELHLSSNIKDIILLTQNLYTLGGISMGSDIDTNSTPMRPILDSLMTEHIRTLFPGHSIPKAGVSLPVFFGSPRFSLESDLSRKQIKVEVSVGLSPDALSPQSVAVDYEDFFTQVIAASGHRRLLDGETR